MQWWMDDTSRGPSFLLVTVTTLLAELACVGTPQVRRALHGSATDTRMGTHVSNAAPCPPPRLAPFRSHTGDADAGGNWHSWPAREGPGIARKGTVCTISFAWRWQLFYDPFKRADALLPRLADYPVPLALHTTISLCVHRTRPVVEVWDFFFHIRIMHRAHV